MHGTATGGSSFQFVISGATIMQTKVATNLPGNLYILSHINRDRFFTYDPAKMSSAIGAVTSLSDSPS